MKKLFFILFCTLTATNNFAQKIFFARENYKDSISIEKNIPLLAKQVIQIYQEKDRLKYFDNLLRLQITAQLYSAARNSLDSAATVSGRRFGDTISTKAFGFQYKIYCIVMLNNQGISEGAYHTQFETAYNVLSNNAQTIAASYFQSDVSKNKRILETTIKSVSDKDSLTTMEALNLCRVYCANKVYNSTQLYAKAILARIESDKYIENDSVLVKMPDGGTVSLTIVRDKKIATPQPVILLYNIYAGNDDYDCKAAVSKGYTGVVANTRGKRLSPDNLEPFEHDAKDAYYIIDWISKQTWCNGSIGMYGGSYLGFAQWSAAKYLHPALKTIVPQVAVGAGIDYPMQNGVFMNYMLRWLHYVMDDKLTDNAGFRNDKKWDSTFGVWYRTGASFRSLDTIEGRPNLVFQRWLKHPGYDSYWQNMTPQKEEFSKINIPILTTTGYWDDDQLGAMYYYQQYHKWNKNPNYYLIIGPYDHGGSQGFPKKQLSGYTIDSVANIPIYDIVFQWFDHVLKDKPLPSILKDKVNFEVMGANEWKHVSSLDQMHNDSLTFYLGNVAAGKEFPLLTKKPAIAGFITQTIDMADRRDMLFKSGDIDAFPLLIDTTLQPGKEKLVFASEAINTPFTVSGALTASITISINKKDIDMVLDLYEQTPDGKFFALNETLQRASYFKDRTNRQLLEPNKIETIQLNHTFITSNQFQKGSRIIVTVGVNKSPSWQINYGTGKDVSDETIADAKIPLQIKWYNTSHVTLQLLK